MKIIKNIFKWLLCAFLTFTVIFTINVMNDGGIEDAIVVLSYQKYEQELKEDAEEIVKDYENMMNSFFDDKESSKENEIFLSENYNEYPAGTVYFMNKLAQTNYMGRIVINSLILGFIIGTPIFLLINSKERKGIRLVIVIYILSIVILGFFQGVNQVAGENLSIIDYWVFPDEYIIPATIAFGLVVLIRIIKQKDIANKLNEKLKEIKQNKS